jgi:hypothetical protein
MNEPGAEPFAMALVRLSPTRHDLNRIDYEPSAIRRITAPGGAPRENRLFMARPAR